MIAPNAHYLLFCSTRITGVSKTDAAASPDVEQAKASPQLNNRTTLVRGKWHFVLDKLDGDEKFEVADSESCLSPDRLALLCVVRGLEALEQPSRVTLVTTSRYVMRGMRFGLNSWRESGYCWERFGVQKPIRNADLWKRVDVALDYHGVDCRMLGAAQNAEAAETSSQADEAEECLVDSQTNRLPSVQPAGYADNGSTTSGAVQGETLVARGQTAVRRGTEPAVGLKNTLEQVNKWWKLRTNPKPALIGS